MRIPKSASAVAMAAAAQVAVQTVEQPPQAAVAEPTRLLIMAPRVLVDPLAVYATVKGEGGTPAEVVELETVLAASPGADEPEKVKRYLYERWRKEPARLRYVLLVGDADGFPVRYMVLDRVTAPAFDYAFYPSDLYYADVARADGTFEDWNAQKEGFHAGYFGEVRGEKNKTDPINYDGVDYRPELAVGRWPVSTVEEVERIARKSVQYELAMNGNFGEPPAGQAAFVAVGGWIENRPPMEAMAAALAAAPRPWTVYRRFWRDKKTPDADVSVTPALPWPEQANIVEMLNSGVALVCHSGHGSDDRWDGSLTVADIKLLHNRDLPAVMLSAGCSTARLATLPPYEAYTDVSGAEHAGTNAGEVFNAPPPPPAPYQRGKHNPTGLGEQMLRAADTGAVVYIGCNTGSQPCGMTLMEGFVDALARSNPGDPAPTAGDCWAQAVSFYYDRQKLAEIKPTEDWYPASIFFQGMKFMFYGDPSLPMRGWRPPLDK